MCLHVGLQPILAKKVFETHWTMINFIVSPLIPFTGMTILENLQKEKNKSSLDQLVSNKTNLQSIQNPSLTKSCRLHV